MLDDYKVNVTYKKDDQYLNKTYSITDYCYETGNKAMRILYALEKYFNGIHKSNNSEQWNEEQNEIYKQIRKNVLNVSNSIKRLPQDLYYKNQRISSIELSDFVGNILNNNKKE